MADAITLSFVLSLLVFGAGGCVGFVVMYDLILKDCTERTRFFVSIAYICLALFGLVYCTHQWRFPIYANTLESNAKIAARQREIELDKQIGNARLEALTLLKVSKMDTTVKAGIEAQLRQANSLAVIEELSKKLK